MVALVVSTAGLRFGSATRVVAVAADTAAIGLAEELMFRGVVFALLFRWGGTVAGLASGLLFGLTHLSNFCSGAPLGDTMLQVMFATGVGIVLGWLRFVVASLWVGVVFHWWVDLTQFLGRAEAGSLAELVILALLAGTAVLLRRHIVRVQTAALATDPHRC